MCDLQQWTQGYEQVTGAAESDHTKDSRGKSNGRAIHGAGSHTINLTVFLSSACSLPFSLTNFRGKKKQNSFCSFPFLPLTFPLNLQIQWLTPSSSSFLPSSSSPCWLIRFNNGTLFHLAMPASLSATYTLTPNLFHFPDNFQMNFIGMKWRSPFTSLFTTSLRFCFEFTSESFIGMLQWQ